MSDHDDDIDFDFFGDSAPEPPKKRLVRRPSGPTSGGGSPPPKRPVSTPHNNNPAVRLVSLIAFAIALILILIFAVRSCQSSNESSAYKSYMEKVAGVATDSQLVGKELTTLLDRQDLKEAIVEKKLEGLISRQQIDIDKASKLAPPGPLRKAHEQMVEALQLRKSALTGLLTVFSKTSAKHGSVEATKAGVALSQQMQRGVASDVLWEDMFVSAVRGVLKEKGITGAPPPNSVFIADTVRATVNSMGVVWQRFHGVQVSNTSGTTHGTNIAYVKVMPAGETLNEGITKPIKIRKDLKFVVGVKNGGDYLEQNIKVTLLIKQSPQAITRSQTIDEIYSGSTKEVVFKGPFNITDPINQIPLKIDVTPVTGETYTGNNRATYEVRFTF